MGTKILITDDYEQYRGKIGSNKSVRDAFDAMVTLEIKNGKVKIIKNMLGGFKGEMDFGLIDLEEGPCGYKRQATGASSPTQ